MKILHVAPIGHHAEGIGTVLRRLVPLQVKLGHDVLVVSVFENAIYSDLKIRTIKNGSDFKTFIGKWQPDIVQFHSLYNQEYIAFGKILKQSEIPYVVQMHGALSEENYRRNHWKKWLANKLWWNQFLKDAKTIIYLNKAEYDKCIVKNTNPNATFIPNGCDRPENVSFERNTEGTLDIMFIGRISYVHKGLDVLVEAIRLLKKRDVKGFHISFFGNENDTHVEWLKQQLVDLHELAAYEGGIYSEAKDKRMRSCNMFILTSRYEGMPMGVLEAFSYGVPCIVTPGSNMYEDVKEANAGWVCQFDANEIADTIIKACEDYSKNPLFYHTNAFKKSEEYDWEVIAGQSVNVLTKNCGLSH